jgi:hypothetical protein
MRKLAVSFWICVLPCCGTSGSLIGGDFIDSWADSRSDTGVDTGFDPGVDPGVDPEPHAPFSFVLVNPTSEPMYVDWSLAGNVILGRRFFETEFETMHWFPPFCTLPCPSMPGDECGCIDCAPPEPVVVEVPPASEIRVLWEGPLVYTLSNDRCGCDCSIEEQLNEPSYAPHIVDAGVESYSGYACWGGCGVDPDGFIHAAYTDGERYCAQAASSLPLTGDMVLVLGGAECWERW